MALANEREVQIVSDTPPPAPRRRAALTSGERWFVAGAAVAPVGIAAVVLMPFAVFGRATVLEVVAAAIVYGGLVGLAAGFVAFDRMQHRQCPRCQTRNPRGAPVCEDCGYDVKRRPRYACSERHELYLEPGLCDCGRRLQELEVARGVGPEVRAMVRFGGWLLLFLVSVGLLLQLATR